MFVVRRRWLHLFLLSLLVCVVTCEEESAVVAEEEEKSTGSTSVEDGERFLERFNDAMVEFSVYVKGLSDSDVSSEVFGSGEVQLLWLCTNDSKDFCFYDSQHAERITFEFYYAGEAEYKFENLFLTNASSNADPKVVAFSNDEVSRAGEFTIEYNCKEEGDLHLSVEFPFRIFHGENQKEAEISFSWVKHCPSPNAPPNVRLGYVDTDLHNPNVPFESKGTKLRIGAYEGATVIFLELTGQGPRSFGEPVATVSNDAVQVTVHVPLDRIVYSDSVTQFQLLYNCLRREEAEITLTVPIPPHEPLSATWIKDCSGAVARGIDVSSPTHGMLWQGGNSFENSHFTVPVNESIVPLKVMNDFDGGEVRFGAVTIIPDRPSIVYARVDEPSYAETYVQTFLSAGSSYLPAGAKAELRLKVICKEAGSSEIKVILSPAGFDPIEFTFTKLCTMPMRRRSRSFRTAKRMMNMALLVIAVAVVFAFYLVGRRKGNKSAMFNVRRRAAAPTVPRVVMQ